jgi:DNA-binding protein HU-beta
MNKKELAIRVAEASDLSDAAGQTAVDAAFDIIAQALTAGDKVVIAGFGAFEVRSRAARQGRNLHTGEVMTIEASRSVGFKPASALKDSIKKTPA